MRSCARHRRWVGWFCIAALLWMGLAAQRHVLSHAVDAVHASGKPDAPAEHALTCAQCLQFAGFDAVPSAPSESLPRPGLPAIDAQRHEPQRRAEIFVAYASRAPPAG